jgi:hypothetical protein
VYVRNADDARSALAEAGGHLVGGGSSDWEIVVVDFPFESGPAPLVVAALELGATPRGREMLETQADQITNGWRNP